MPELPRVYVFYDYGCAYSHVGLRRAQALDERVDVDWIWVPWEMYPSIGDQGDPIEGVDEPRQHPVRGLVGRLADEVDETLYWPPSAPNTEDALRGALVARELGPEPFAAYHEAAFEAIWHDGLNVADPDVLAAVVDQAGLDPDAVLGEIHADRIDAALDAAQDAVERLRLTRRPTFVFGDQRIVGTDAFEPSLAGPLEAFADRWHADGPDNVVGLEDDVDLRELLHPAG